MAAKENLRVLVIDDTKMSRRHSIQVLSQLQISKVMEAEDGEVAWEVLQSNQFDFLLLDWMMPKLSGIDLLKRIRSEDRFKDLVVFMITAEADRTHILEAIQAGVSDYIVKPMNPVALIEKINTRFK